MSVYLSFAPIIERTAAENRSALPEAPQLQPEPRRTRATAAAVLRRTAQVQLRLAARLEQPAARRLATA
jgi:hypothetical protein